MTRLKVLVTPMKPPDLKFSHNIHNRGISLQVLDLGSLRLVYIIDLGMLPHTETVLTVQVVRGCRERVSLVTPRPLLLITSPCPLHSRVEVTPADLTPGEATAPLVTVLRLPEASLSRLLGQHPGSIVTPACLLRGQEVLGHGKEDPG